MRTRNCDCNCNCVCVQRLDFINPSNYIRTRNCDIAHNTLCTHTHCHHLVTNYTHQNLNENRISRLLCIQNWWLLICIHNGKLKLRRQYTWFIWQECQFLPINVIRKYFQFLSFNMRSIDSLFLIDWIEQTIHSNTK